MGDPNLSGIEVYLFGPYRLDVAARRLTATGETVALPPKAFELLVLLVRNSERAMRRTELLDAVWRDTVVEEGSLGWNMSVLRRALDRTDEEVIETVRGFGYRFALPVRRETPGSVQPGNAAIGGPDVVASAHVAPPGSQPATGAARPAELATPAEPIPAPPSDGGDSGAPVTPTAASRRRSRTAVAVGLALLGVAVIAYFALTRLPDAEAGGARRPPSPTARTLAVLPFENLSGRPDQAWISVALAEILSSELALGREATTVPQESVAFALGSGRPRSSGGLGPASLARLRDRLGLDLVVVGTYVVAGEPPTLRVDLRLQDAADGSTRFAWSQSRPVDEFLRIASDAGAELRRQVSSGAAAAPSAEQVGFAVAPEALRAYTEGLELRRRFELGEARGKFEEAVAVAPEFAVARAALAGLLAELGHERDAVAASHRALADAGKLARSERLPIEARNAELEGRWGEAAALWQEVTRLEPGPLEHRLAVARALSRAGRHDEARATLDELARRPPPVGEDPRIDLERGWVERYAQDFAAMATAGRRAADAGRRLPSNYVLAEASSIVAWAELSLDRYPAGLRACEEGQRVARRIGHDRLWTLNALLCGWLQLNSGHPDKAEHVWEEAERAAEHDGNAIHQASALTALASMRVDAGRLASAAELVARARDLARGVGDREREVNALGLLSQIAVDRAELGVAERYTVEALAKARELNIASRIAAHLGALGRIRLERGDAAGALAAHEEAVRVSPATTFERGAALEIDLARSRLASGDAVGAVATCDAALARPAGNKADDPQRWRVLLVRARAEAQLGRGDRARVELERLDGPLQKLDPSHLGLEVQRERGMLLQALGEDDAARTVWRAILDAPTTREATLVRLVATVRLAELDAGRAPADAVAVAQLAAARDRARTAKLGLLLGERF